MKKERLFSLFLTLLFLSPYSVFGQVDLRVKVSVEVTGDGPVKSMSSINYWMNQATDVYADYGINLEYCVEFKEWTTVPICEDNDYLEIFITEAYNLSCSGSSICNSANGLGSIVLIGAGQIGTKNIVHEIGHCLGLPHTFRTPGGQGGIRVDANDPYKIYIDDDPDAGCVYYSNSSTGQSLQILDTGIDWNMSRWGNDGHWGGRDLIGDCDRPQTSGICADVGNPVDCPASAILGFPSNNGYTSFNGFKPPWDPAWPDPLADYNSFIREADCQVPAGTSLSNRTAVITNTNSCASQAQAILNVQQAGALRAIVCADDGDVFTGSQNASVVSQIAIPAMKLSVADCAEVIIRFKNRKGPMKFNSCVSPHVFPILYDLGDCGDQAMTLNPDPDNLFKFYMESDHNTQLTEYPSTNAYRNYMSYIYSPNCQEFTPDQEAVLQAWANERRALQVLHSSGTGTAPDVESAYLGFTYLDNAKHADEFPVSDTYIIEDEFIVEGDLVIDGADVLFTKDNSKITVREGGSLTFNNCNIRKTDNSGLCQCSNYSSGNFTIKGEANSTIIIQGGSTVSEMTLDASNSFVTIESSTISHSSVTLSKVSGFYISNSNLNSVLQNYTHCNDAFIVGTTIEGESELNITGGSFNMASDLFYHCPITLNKTNVLFNYPADRQSPSILFGDCPIVGIAGASLSMNYDIMAYNGSTTAISGNFNDLNLLGCDLIINPNAEWIDVSTQNQVLAFNYFENLGSADLVRIDGGGGLIMRNLFEGNGSDALTLTNSNQTNITCNRFTNSNIAIAADDGIGDQGGKFIGAGNRFDDNDTDVEIDGLINYYVHDVGDRPNSASSGFTERYAKAVCDDNDIRTRFRCGLRLVLRSPDCPGGLPQWMIDNFIARYGASCIIVIGCPEVPDPCEELDGIPPSGDVEHPCKMDVGDGEPGAEGKLTDATLESSEGTKKDFAVYPNPTSDFFNLTFDFEALDEVQYEVNIYSIHGQLMEKVVISDSNTQFLTDRYETGLYIVQLVIDGDVIGAKKLTIIK